MIVGWNNTTTIGVDASTAQVRAIVRRPLCEHNSVTRYCAESGIVCRKLKSRKFVVREPRVRNERPADAVIERQSSGRLPVIAEVELDIAPARIADGVFIVLVHAPEHICQNRV